MHPGHMWALNLKIKVLSTGLNHFLCCDSINVVRLSNDIGPIILISLSLTHPHFLEDDTLSWMISFTMTRMSIMSGQKGTWTSPCGNKILNFFFFCLWPCAYSMNIITQKWRNSVSFEIMKIKLFMFCFVHEHTHTHTHTYIFSQ